MDKTTINPILIGVTAVAVIIAGWTIWHNRTLNGELDGLKAVRASMEREVKAANERTVVAERSTDEIKSEMSRVQAANETINHSVTQLRNQLEQVQIQANTAREESEKRSKAAADELSKVQGDATWLKGETERLGQELARARAEKEAALTEARSAEERLKAELKQAQDALVGERTARGAGNGSSTGAPAQANP
jgi:chromosome segregation ATPase